MPPRVPALAQSENKAKFLERLGIPSQNEQGKQIYQMMKEEAIAGRARMSESTACLLPELVNDPSVKPPYSNTQIKESAMHAQTLYIYRTARPETRMYYELGHYLEGDTEENWVIKWLLWHVFRYRDNRNRGRSIPTTSPVDRAFPQAGQPGASGVATSLTELNSANRLSISHLAYPVPPPNPGELSVTSLRSTTPISMTSTGTGTITNTNRPPTRDQYWDPVRDAQAANDNGRSHSPRS